MPGALLISCTSIWNIDFFQCIHNKIPKLNMFIRMSLVLYNCKGVLVCNDNGSTNEIKFDSNDGDFRNNLKVCN